MSDTPQAMTERHVTLLPRARELARNEPQCLVSPAEYRRVIGALADRVERLEEALRRIDEETIDHKASTIDRAALSETEGE